MKKKQNLINCTLSGLIGKDVAGIVAQVRNPIYLSAESPPCWRTLKYVRVYKENHKEWVEGVWEKHPDDSCNYTGCTRASDTCTFQFTPEEFAKIKPLKKS